MPAGIVQGLGQGSLRARGALPEKESARCSLAAPGTSGAAGVDGLVAFAGGVEVVEACTSALVSAGASHPLPTGGIVQLPMSVSAAVIDAATVVRWNRWRC
jgi:hypothetical protein